MLREQVEEHGEAEHQRDLKAVPLAAPEWQHAAHDVSQDDEHAGQEQAHHRVKRADAQLYLKSPDKILPITFHRDYSNHLMQHRSSKGFLGINLCHYQAIQLFCILLRFCDRKCNITTWSMTFDFVSVQRERHCAFGFVSLQLCVAVLQSCRGNARLH